MLGERVFPHLWRRKVSNASWIEDRRGLKKSIQLCSACQYRMPHNWLRRFHYYEFEAYHGEGFCDSCRKDAVITLYLSQEDPWYLECERQARVSQALDHEESRARAFTVADRRRLWAVPGSA